MSQGYQFSRATSYALGVIALAGIILAAHAGCAGTAAIEPPLSPPGNAGSAHQRDLTVFAAASLTQAFAQLAETFEGTHPGVSVNINFDGSQRLRTQLEHGAQADVFASADWEQMEAVGAAGLIERRPVNFAGNRLVFLVSSSFSSIRKGPPDAPTYQTAAEEKSASVTLKDLARPGVKIVLALPEVPAGRYSQVVINRMGNSQLFGPDYRNRLLGNVVSRETNVRSVTQKVALGEADAGIAYRTDALAAYTAPRIQVLTIPDALNVTARYPIALLRESAQSELAQAFIDLTLSAEGQAILEQYGFEPPLPATTGKP